MENKEVLLSEPPKDVDVVTFFYLPTGETELSFFPKVQDLFDIDAAKKQFRVDPYPCILGNVFEAESVREVSYWYSMWSHRRTGLWKGFVQIDISETEDKVAAALLDQIELDEFVKP